MINGPFKKRQAVGEMMVYTHAKIPFFPILGPLCLVMLSACANLDQNNGTVPVNLSLVVDSTQAHNQSTVSPLMAFIQRWFPSAGSAWAQTVSDITTIQVQILGPDISEPPTTTVPVTNPTSGGIIPVSIQAPVGSNRTIAVEAMNAAKQQIFSGSVAGVTLAPGAPVNLTVTLTRTSTPPNTHHLTVNKSGTGTGTVTSNPAGISCGTTCAADFAIGSTVVLTAAPTGGSTFTGWSGGGCGGTGSCTVVMNADQTVTATFTAPANTFTLTVTKAGVGIGTVTSSPAGIDCGTTCSFPFSSGTTVTLTAAPASGSTFAGWSGSGCSGTGTCVVAMSANRSVTATFNAVPSTLTVTKVGGGTGTVTSSPAGINCGNTCSASFPTGSSVTLTATASAGSIFAGWSGGGCSGTGTCTTVMATSQTVVATFNIAPTLTVNKSGTGNGTVTSSPGGINCGSDCSQSYAQGTVVTLTAAPNGTSTFAGWSGAGCAGTGTCIVVMNSNQTVNAQFNKN